MTSTGKRIRAPVNFDMDGGMQMEKKLRMTSGDVMMKDDEDFISDLQSFVGRVRHKVGEVALLRSTLSAKDVELQDAKSYLQELEERNHHAQHKVNKLSRDIVSLEENNRALSFENKKKDEAVEELKRDVTAGKELLEQRTADVVRTRRALDEKEQSFEAMVSEKENQAKEQREIQDRLQSRIESLSEVNNAMEKKVAEREAAVAAVNDEKKQLEKHVANVMSELKSSERRVNELNNEVETALKAKRAIEERQMDMKSRMESLTSTNVALKHTVTELRDEHAQAAAAKAEITVRAAEQEQSIKKLIASIDRHTDENEELKRKLQEAQEDSRVSREAATSTLKRFRDQLEMSKQDAEGKQKEMTEIVANHEKHIEELEAWKIDAIEQSKKKEERLDDVVRELRSVVQDNGELEKRLAKSETDRSSLCKMFQEESEAQKSLVMQLQERLEATEGKLSKEQEISEQLRTDLQESVLASKRASKENENARSDFDRLEARLEEMTVAAEKAKVALADAEAENARIVQDMKSQLAAERVRVEQLEKQKEGLVEEIRETRKEKAASSERLTNNIQAQMRQITALTKTRAELNGDLNSNQRKLEGTQKDLRDIKAELDKVKSERDSSAAENESLSKLCRELEEHMRDLEQSFSETLQEHDQLKKELQETQENLETARHEKRQLQEEAAGQILAFSERGRELNHEMQAVEGEKAKLAVELKNKNAILENALSTISELKNELHAAESDAEATIADLREQSIAAQERLKEVSSEHERAMARAAERLQAQVGKVSAIQKSKASLEAALEDRGWEIEALKRDVVTARSEHETLEREVERLKRDNQSLKKIESNMSGFLQNVLEEQKEVVGQHETDYSERERRSSQMKRMFVRRPKSSSMASQSSSKMSKSDEMRGRFALPPVGPESKISSSLPPTSESSMASSTIKRTTEFLRQRKLARKNHRPQSAPPSPSLHNEDQVGFGASSSGKSSGNSSSSSTSSSSSGSSKTSTSGSSKTSSSSKSSSSSSGIVGVRSSQDKKKRHLNGKKKDGKERPQSAPPSPSPAWDSAAGFGFGFKGADAGAGKAGAKSGDEKAVSAGKHGMKKSSSASEQSMLPPLARAEAAEEASDVIRRTADFLRERNGSKGKGSNKENESMKIPHIKQSKSMDGLGADNGGGSKRSKSASDRAKQQGRSTSNGNKNAPKKGGGPLQGNGARPFSAPLGRDMTLR